MKVWFKVRGSYEKLQENGMTTNVTEVYLLDALSFTEAEARGIEEIRPFVEGDLSISGITKSQISEVFFSDYGDILYKAKVQFCTLNEKTGGEKWQSVYIIVQACDFEDAVSLLTKKMESTLSTWKIVELKETPIVSVFPYPENKTYD